jgi:hypothetical protein
MAKKPGVKLCIRRLLAAQGFNETDGEKANALKDEAVGDLLDALGLNAVRVAYDNVVKLYEDQTRTK